MNFLRWPRNYRKGANMEIKKGDRFECIKTVLSNGSDKILYTEGEIYVSESDGRVTDNQGNINRTGDKYFWREHFRRIKSVSTEPQTDPVNSPSHYTQGKIESIDAIESALGGEGFKGFLAGNAMKYVHRYRHKNGIEDVKKARWYIDRLIKTLENEGT